MNTQEWFSKQLKAFGNDPEYIAEGLRIDLIEQFLKIMEEQTVSRAELARRLGCSNAYVTKLLNGKVNFTLLKLAQIGVALGRKVKVAFVPAGAVKRTVMKAIPKRINELKKDRFASTQKSESAVN